jgi:branched-chain amino acid transport system permease protein
VRAGLPPRAAATGARIASEAAPPHAPEGNSLEALLQHVLNALILGGTYALLGIGLTLIFGIMRVVNFTHGELYTFGAYMMYMWVMRLHVNFFVALPLAMALGVALGALIEFVLLRRLRGADIDTTMLVMIGAWIALQNTEQLVWSGVAQSISTPFPSQPLQLGAVSVGWDRLFVFAVAVALIWLTYHLINRTRLGKAMRATFQDRETAMLMGVDVDLVYMATFALGSGLAAAAGALLGPVFVVQPTMGDLASLKAFAIVILGGLGNIPGATIGGFLLAFLEELGAGYLSSGFRDGMGFLVIIAILVFRPTGLFAQKERIG